MKYLNKLASVFFVASLGVMALTSCEGSDMYNVNAPSWLSEKGEDEPEPEEQEELVGQMEDVYDIGKADCTAGFFTLGKTYIVPAGQKWQAQFNLLVNSDNKYYKNFYIVLNALKEDGTLGDEYGVIRYDNDPSKNSEWNTVGSEINRSLVKANFSNSSPTEGDDLDVDPNVQKLNGTITLTVDRTDGGLFIKMTNGTMTKTYTQTTAFPSTGADAPLACRIGVDGSFVSFLSTNIEPIGGCTSAEDKEPATLTLANLPSTVTVGTPLEEAMAKVTGVVTFEGTPATLDVTAEDLIFEAVPDYEKVGEKTLVVLYNKTFKGENASKPVMATATFKVVNEIESIAITKAPGTFYFYTSDATKDMTDRTLALPSSCMEVTATYIDGTSEVMDPASLTFSITTVPAKAGSYEVTVSTENGKEATTKITVEESTVTAVHPTPTILGAEDNSSPFWTEPDQVDVYLTKNIQVPVGSTYQVDFTNYTSAGSNWNNYVVILRSMNRMPEYGVMRADNYGWASGYDNNPLLRLSGGQADWAAWLAAMNGAKCTAYVTNTGNGTADVQIIMNGNDSKVYYQYYLGVLVNMDDLGLAFTIDHSHIVFD